MNRMLDDCPRPSRLTRAIEALRGSEPEQAVKWSAFTMAGSVGAVAAIVVAREAVQIALDLAGWISWALRLVWGAM